MWNMVLMKGEFYKKFIRILRIYIIQKLDSIIRVLGLKDYEPKTKASFTMSSLGESQEIIILEN